MPQKCPCAICALCLNPKILIPPDFGGDQYIATRPRHRPYHPIFKGVSPPLSPRQGREGNSFWGRGASVVGLGVAKWQAQASGQSPTGARLAALATFGLGCHRRVGLVGLWVGWRGFNGRLRLAYGWRLPV